MSVVPSRAAGKDVRAPPKSPEESPPPPVFAGVKQGTARAALLAYGELHLAFSPAKEALGRCLGELGGVREQASSPHADLRLRFPPRLRCCCCGLTTSSRATRRRATTRAGKAEPPTLARSEPWAGRPRRTEPAVCPFPESGCQGHWVSLFGRGQVEGQSQSRLSLQKAPTRYSPL